MGAIPFFKWSPLASCSSNVKRAALFCSSTTVSQRTYLARTRRGRHARSEGRMREAPCGPISSVHHRTFNGGLWSLVLGGEIPGDVCGDCFSLRRIHWSSSALGDKSDRNVDNGVQPSDEKSKGLEEMREVASLVLPWNERQHCTSQMFAMFV